MALVPEPPVNDGPLIAEVNMATDSPATTVRATVVQAATVFYDTPATLDKAERLLAEAASYGSQLVVFPEAFVGGYPRGSSFGVTIGNRTAKGKEDFRKYHASAIDVPGPEVDQLAAMAGKYKVHLVMGVIERDGYTLYCTVLFFDSQGCYLGKHRKLMPTALERIIWGFGDGSTIPVFGTPIGKIGAAICWENRMPLLRTAMYAKGIEIYCAPTADARDIWQASMTHIALEGGCFVLSANQFCRRKDYPPAPEYEFSGDEDLTPDSVVCAGGSVIISPTGTVLAGPNYDGEALITADLDLGDIARAKFDFDVVGHYARPEVLSLTVKDHPTVPVTFASKPEFPTMSNDELSQPPSPSEEQHFTPEEHNTEDPNTNQGSYEQMLQTPFTQTGDWTPNAFNQYMQAHLWSQGVMGQPSNPVGQPSNLTTQPSNAMGPPPNFGMFRPPMFDPHNMTDNFVAGQQQQQFGGVASGRTRMSSTSSSVGPMSASTQERRTKWPPAVDMVLITAWLRTSKDPITGTSQTHDTFWSTVTRRFIKAGKFKDVDYTVEAVKSHWNKSQRRVKRYITLLNKEKVQESNSGWNDERFRERAQELYQIEVSCIKNEPKVFKLHHWIQPLEDDPRFWAEEGTAGAQRRRLNGSGSYSTTPPNSIPTDGDNVTGLDGDDEPTGGSPIHQGSPIGMPPPQKRPIGNKAAKRKGKGMADRVSAIALIDQGNTEKAKLTVTLDAKVDKYMEQIRELHGVDTSQMDEEQRETHAKLLSLYCAQASKLQRQIEAILK